MKITRDSKPVTAPQLGSADSRLLEKKISSARRTLTFERRWPRVWLPLAIAGVFVLGSVFQLWAHVSPQVHAILLYGFLAAFALASLRLVFFRRATREDALARLESASELNHRPLTALHDNLSETEASPEARALWRAHQTRNASLLRRLKAGPAHPRIDRYDPLALRAALVLVLAAVSAWSWAELPTRVRAAFIVPESPVASDFRLDVWVTPPSYTRKEPMVLANGSMPKAGSKDAVSVPKGSALTVKINGADAANYSVLLGGNEGAKPLAPTVQSGENFLDYAANIEQSTTLTVKRNYGSTMSWSIVAVADQPPTVMFTGPVEVSNRGAMLFKYRAQDDYGVVSAEAVIERGETSAPVDGKSQSPLRLGKPPIFGLSLPRSPIKSAEGKTYKDLTAHPWAGLPVVVTLVAKDEIGAEGRSAARGLILPERKFTKPLARAVIGQRRELVENPTSTTIVAQSLNALLITAQDEKLRAPIYLGLRSAYSRLRKNPPIDEVEAVVEQLWDLAIKIEDGNLPEAERALRAAQEKLKEALERGAPPEEIQKLVAELREAMNRFMQALAAQPQESRDRNASQANSKKITQQDLQKLLNRIENLAKSGSNQAAEQMLNELRDILESLQAARQGGQREGQSGQGQQEDGESLQQLDKLTNLMRQQQQLLDQTFRAQQDQQNGNQGRSRPDQRGGKQNGRGQGAGQESGQQKGQGEGAGETASAEQLRQRQDQIRQGLQDLLNELPGGDGDSIRQKLQDAERSMGEAGNSLGAGELPQASDEEAQALDRLRQGTRAMAEQMMKSQSGGSQGGQASRDPLGRQQGGQLNDPGNDVKVPDEITVQRAREILEELRKRLGEPSRPPVELDYLERLIKRF